MKVKDIMAKGVVTVRERTPVLEIARIMAAKNISGVAVLDEEDNLAGTVSETDLLRVIGEGRNLRELRARELMTPCAITASPEMSLEEVAELMVTQGVHRLFVSVDEEVKPARVWPKYKEKLVGVVSTRDLVREIAGRQG
jgi:CBS domain-containing protein